MTKNANICNFLCKLLSNANKQCCGSVTFWYGSGSPDKYLGLTDPDSDPDPDPTPDPDPSPDPAPDPAIFSDLQDGN
jgi:hypothetical protein